MSYSPGEAGGTLHFPSPTHLHNVDPTSALRQLRRSLSRSPSKSPAFRLVTSKSASPSPRSPLSPPGRSHPIRSLSANLLSCPSTTPPSSLSAHPRSNAKNSRSAPRRLSPMRSSSRSSSSQRSPVRKVLTESQCHGNATPSSSAGSSDDIENNISQENSAISSKVPAITILGKDVEMHDILLAPRPSFARNEKGSGRFVSFGAKSSPLKRSDGITDMDQATFGSPAKRRSLHASSFGPDFNIFDHEATALGQLDGCNSDEGTKLDASTSSDSSYAFSQMPKRTSSLRKTTLQQRHEKPIFARSKANADLALDFSTPGHFAPKGRQRMSLDGNLPSVARESPFSSQGSLPNASVHPLTQEQIGFHSLVNQAHPQRHPLSRTISQSSSASGLAEDSPTHIPVRQPESRRVDFSRSLPVGARRPENKTDGPSSQASSTGASFATPENYKLAKPLPAAFMSTGLISKRNKNIEDTHSGLFAGVANMPDTPCKRPILQEPPTPLIAPFSVAQKARQVRHSFGTPSTPFSPHASRVAPGTFGKGASIFGTLVRGGLHRRASFASIDGEDASQSPPSKNESQSSTDCDVPPTPTKQMLLWDSTRIGPLAQNEMKAYDARSDSVDAVEPRSRLEPDCEYFPGGRSISTVEGDSDSALENSPTATLSFRRNASTPSSFTKSRFLKCSKSPTPLSKKPFNMSSSYPRKFKAKPSPLSPASPMSKRIGSLSPHTPLESMVPPDPSGLSISAHGDRHDLRPSTSSGNNISSRPPATPTAPRDSLHRFANRRSSVTPVHGLSAEVDPSLTSRFDKVELIGNGQFSQVYCVSKKQDSKSAQGYFSLPATRASPKTSLPDQVWAIKKARHAYIGVKDRQRKLKEVAALKAFGQSDHTIQYFDSWEEKNYLYIQTEFCEEGSLDTFLNQAGRQARLDDFRIWKIMLELCLVSTLQTLSSLIGPTDLFSLRVSNISMTVAICIWILSLQMCSLHLKVH